MDSAQRALDALDEAISRDGDQPQEVDALLLETLAAVVRAVAGRPWISGAICLECGGVKAAVGGAIQHDDQCRYAAADAALDAFAVAAQEMFP